MQPLLDAFFEALRNPNVRVSHSEIDDFLKFFPGKLSEEDKRKILVYKNSDEPQTKMRDVLKAFESDGEFAGLIPSRGFLYDYALFTKELEAPLEFHFFSSLCALGQVIGRKVFIDRGAYKIFCPLPVILVAPSGICRKTSAMQLAVKLARSVGVQVIANKVTPEDLVRQLQDHVKGSNCLIAAPELAVMVGKQRYNTGLVEILTDLLDCPDYWESGTIMRGKTELRDVCLGVIGASTPKWLRTSIPLEAFAGGFMSRVLLIVKNETPRCSPEPPPLDEKLWKQMRGFLNELSAVQEPMKISKQASAWYQSWYRQHRSQVQKAGEDLVGYQSRKPNHILRMAMLLQLAKQSTTITPSSLQHAVQVFDWIDKQTPAVVRNLMSSEAGQVQQMIVAQLKRRGGYMSKVSLIRLFSKQVPKRLFEEALITLLQTQQIGMHHSPAYKEEMYFLKDWTED